MSKPSPPPINKVWTGWEIIDNGHRHHPDSVVSGVSESMGRLDIFSIHPDGGVDMNYYDSGSWKKWYRDRFHVIGGTYPQNYRMAAVERRRQIDIFAVDTSGVVHTAWWNGGRWQGTGTISVGPVPAPETVAIIPIENRVRPKQVIYI